VPDGRSTYCNYFVRIDDIAARNRVAHADDGVTSRSYATRLSPR